MRLALGALPGKTADMGYDPRDAFYRRAKKENLRARSAFKLEEIQQRWQLVRPGDAVVDLGAAPGGFLQILARIVGPSGRVVGVDLAAIRPLGGVVATLQADVYDAGLGDRLAEALGRPASAVLSDLAPKTSGIRAADEARSLGLAERALELALRLGAPGGNFVAKVFMGGGFDEYLAQVKKAFRDVRIVRPEATRTHSREVYVVARGRREPDGTASTQG